MSLPAPYTRQNIAQYFFHLCPLFLLGSSYTLPFITLPLIVPFQFSPLFPGLISTSYYFYSVCCSPIRLYYISFNIFFFFLPRMFLSSTSSHFSLLPYSFQFLLLFCLHATYCSVRFVSFFVYSSFVHSLLPHSSFTAALITKLRLAGRTARGMRQFRSNSR